VVESQWQYVATSKRQDFRIFEEGVEQKIAYFATVDQPFTVVLLLDTSGSTEFRLETFQEAAITFVNPVEIQRQRDGHFVDDRIDVLIRRALTEMRLSGLRSSRHGGGTRLYDTRGHCAQKYLRTITVARR